MARITILIVILSLASGVRAQQDRPALTNTQLLKNRGEVVAEDAVPFTTPEGGRLGWKVRFPGSRPLATPAVVDGRVYLGGGFGSHTFYAFDALTGRKLWHYRTRDDGPTAAAVLDGHIVFATEGSELEALTIDGRPAWKQRLGEPLMSMPAAANGLVFMAYPERIAPRYALSGFDLRNGREQWRRPIAGEAITAPVVDNNTVYLATVEGTAAAFKCSNGDPVWNDTINATCAPVIADKVFLCTSRAEAAVTKDGKSVPQKQEALAVKPDIAGARWRLLEMTRRDADYLDYAKRGGRSATEQENKKNDLEAGFDNNTAANRATFNLGQNSVAGVWSYQGSRPAVAAGRAFAAMGDTIKCVELHSERLVWRKDLHGPKDKGELLDAAVTPPAVVNGKVFLGTTKGEVICLSAATGVRLWSTTVGEPIAGQPVIAKGRLYVVTARGSLICLETGDVRDDGWLMWGGDAARRGVQQ